MIKKYIHTFLFIGICLLARNIQAQQSETYGDKIKSDVKMHYVYNYDEALKQAKKQNKLIFFNCFADWALPCHVMNQNVFSNQEFCDYMNRTFVNLFVNMPAAEGKPLADKYGVKNYACYLILDSKGNMVQRIGSGGELPEFKEWVDLSLSPKTSLAGTRKKYESGKYSQQDLYRYLKALDVANDTLFRSLSKTYMKDLKPEDYARKENWLFVYPAMKNRESELYPYFLHHRDLFVKSHGTQKVNSMFEYLFYPEVFSYATGDTPYDRVRFGAITDEIKLACLPDTCVTLITHQVARLRGEKRYTELIDYLRENGRRLSIYKYSIDMSLNIPDMNIDEKKYTAAYLKETAERFNGMSAGKPLEEMAERMLEKETGITFLQQPAFDDVLNQAKREGKLVFIDCYTSWCGPCRLMSSNVFTRKEVGEFFNTHFINVKYNMEKGEAVAIRKKYEVNVYPTLLILDSNGKLLKKHQGALNAEDLTEWAKQE